METTALGAAGLAGIATGVGKKADDFLDATGRGARVFAPEIVPPTKMSAEAASNVPLVPRTRLRLSVCRFVELFETIPRSVIALPEMVNALASLANVMLKAVRSAMSLVLVVRVEPAKTYALVDEVVGTLFPIQLETRSTN